MGKPAARVGDMHTCPMTTGPVPHVGGPIIGPGVPTVLIGGLPAVVVGDMATCVGPPDTIIMGSAGVLIGGRPAARMGDMCAHGGMIAVGLPTVLIGEAGSGGPSVVAVPPPAAVPQQSPSQPKPADGAQKSAARSSPNPSAPKAAPQKAAQEKKTFVEIELAYEDGKPASAVKYEVELPDGSIKRGFLDSKGKARVEGVDPGSCKVRFPDIHDQDWQQA